MGNSQVSTTLPEKLDRDQVLVTLSNIKVGTYRPVLKENVSVQYKPSATVEIANEFLLFTILIPHHPTPILVVGKKSDLLDRITDGLLKTIHFKF